jgi:hypothetical protein
MGSIENDSFMQVFVHGKYSSRVKDQSKAPYARANITSSDAGYRLSCRSMRQQQLT